MNDLSQHRRNGKTHLPPRRRQPAIVSQPATYSHIQKGVDVIVEAIRPTLGPRPRWVVMEALRRTDVPEFLDDGATIARRIIAIEPRGSDVGAMLMRHALWKMRLEAGDGTTTMAVMYQAALREGIRAVTQFGCNAMLLRMGLEKGLQAVLQAVQRQARPVIGKQALAQLARGDLAQPHRDAVGFVARALLVVDDEGKGLAACPRQQRAGVGMRVAHGDVHRVDVVAFEDLGHLRHEFLEALGRHEVLLQHVGGVLARRRLELGDVVAGFVVAPVHDLVAVGQRIDQVLAPPLAQRRAGDGPAQVVVQRVGGIALVQPPRLGGRALGFDPGDAAQAVELGRVQVGVVEDGLRVIADLVLEVAQVLRGAHLGGQALQAVVVGQVELGFGDHADAAVAADRGEEQFAVDRARGVLHGGVGQHQFDCTHRMHDRPEADVAAVAV
ncbi:MAG: hypothetical protein HC853_07180 [Anaerolineae bacterium]|nr:hypothetical protein [Anaerolineae bacterium]